MRKLRWFFITMALPEYTLVTAVIDYTLAWESERVMDKLGATQWTMTHGFFANAGGFTVQTNTGKTYPLNARGVALFVERNVIELAVLNRIQKADIDDKSKQDGFGKTITLAKTTAFLVEFAARLPFWGIPITVTPLEILTAYLAVVSAFTYFCFWHKPNDVTRPIPLACTGEYAPCFSDSDNNFMEDVHETYRVQLGDKQDEVGHGHPRIPNGYRAGGDYFLMQRSTQNAAMIPHDSSAHRSAHSMVVLLVVVVFDAALFGTSFLPSIFHFIYPWDSIWKWTAISSGMIPGIYYLWNFFFGYFSRRWTWVRKILASGFILGRLTLYGVSIASLFKAHLALDSYKNVDWIGYIHEFQLF